MHLRAFLNGVFVGILLGVLFAPDSGEETRKKIARRARDAKDSYEDLADKISDTFDKVKSKADDIVHRAKDKFNKTQDETESIYDV